MHFQDWKNYVIVILVAFAISKIYLEFEHL